MAIVALSQLEHFAGAQLRDDAIPGFVNATEITSHSLRGYSRILMAAGATDASEREAIMREYEANSAGVAKAVDSYEKFIHNDEERRNFDELKQRRAAYRVAKDGF